MDSEIPREPGEPVTRRDFIGWIIKGGLLGAIAGMLLPAIAYLWPITRRGPVVSMVEIGRADEIPVWGTKKIVVRGSPVLVIRTPNQFKALSAVCTHLGCIVFWNDGKHQIECPCHAGFFDAEGRVLSGPPPRPLPEYPVRVSDGKLFVTF